MKCRQVRRLLIDFYEGELGGQTQRCLEVHLDSCPKCRTELESLKSALEALKPNAAEPPPEGFWGAYLAGVRAKIDAKRERRWLPKLVPAFEVAVVLIVAAIFLTERGPSRRQGQESWASSLSDIDYVACLAESVVDSVNVSQILIKNILTVNQIAEVSAIPPEEVAVSFGEYESFVSEFGQMEELVSALEEYRIERSRLEDLVDELSEDEQVQLLEKIRGGNLRR